MLVASGGRCLFNKICVTEIACSRHQGVEGLTEVLFTASHRHERHRRQYCVIAGHSGTPFGINAVRFIGEAGTWVRFQIFVWRDVHVLYGLARNYTVVHYHYPGVPF